MPFSSIQAGRTLCEISDWSISNLRLQKVLYFAHMHHLGEKKGPLIKETFEAWDYGPVEPKLYHRVKMYGREAIGKISFYFESGIEKNTSEYDMLKNLYEATKNRLNRDLIDIAHWEEGAWYHCYDPEKKYKPIPNDRILKEYNDREQISEQQYNS